jgi:hypothetical protein
MRVFCGVNSPGSNTDDAFGVPVAEATFRAFASIYSAVKSSGMNAGVVLAA